MYQTLKATVRNGKIELLEDIELPDETPILITILRDLMPPSVGSNIIRGSEDALVGQTVTVRREAELLAHLHQVFSEE